jgi:hypothetical protein
MLHILSIGRISGIALLFHLGLIVTELGVWFCEKNTPEISLSIGFVFLNCWELDGCGHVILERIYPGI